MMKYTKTQLLDIALSTLCCGKKKMDSVRLNRMFRSVFGCSLIVVFQIWHLLLRHKLMPDKGTPIHLYWTLSFLKTYETENFYAAMYVVHENTFRKWVWKFIRAIGNIEIVRTIVPLNSHIWLIVFFLLICIIIVLFYIRYIGKIGL